MISGEVKLILSFSKAILDAFLVIKLAKIAPENNSP